jgi:large repetitive protein
VRNWLTLSVLRAAILLAPVAPFLEAGTNPATITIVATPSPWTNQAQPLSVQVTVNGALGAGTGSIMVYIDNASLGNMIPLSGGGVTFTIPDAAYNIPGTNLQAGTHTIGVAYSGDSNYAGQAPTSNNTTFTVSGPTSTTLTASATQLVLGQTVTFTVNVSIGATGTVTLIDNGLQAIATIPLIGNQAISSPLTLALGSHPIVAQYNGDSNFAPSTSGQLTVTVGKANTTTVLTSPPNHAAASAGTGVTLTAQVAVQSPGSATLSGSVQFLDGGKVLSTQSLSGGTASFTAPNLAAGSHSLTATYTGNSNLNQSTSAPVSFFVNGLPTSIATPTASGNAAIGQQMTITTTVTGPTGAGTPTGNVTFTDGSVAIGTIILNAAGSAALNITFQAPGTHFIFATYNGDATFAPSPTSSVLALAICPNNPTVTVTSSVTAPVYGQTVIFTGSVSPIAPGTMDFLADGQSMLSGTPVTMVNGQAQFAPASGSTLPSGAHEVNVIYYCGTGGTGISSNTLNLIVNSDNSTTTLNSSPASPLQLTAIVTPNAPGYGTPTGTIQFMSGTTQLAAVPLDASTGIAEASYTASGSGSVVAVYSGDANFFSSTSLPVNIATFPTTVSLTSSANPALVGANITFTATVTSSGGGVPTGTVDFLEGATALASAVPLSPTGQAQFSTNALPAGSNAITANYNPSGIFQTAQATIGQYVSPGGGGGTSGNGSNTLSVSVSPQPAVFSQAITLTATATPEASGTPPNPTGNVTFQSGSTVLGTAPIGQGITLNSLAPGTYNVTASYSGDANYVPSQAAISFVMSQAATQTTYAPALNQSGQASLTATVTVVAPGAGTPTGTVQFQDASENNLTVTTATLAGGTATAIVDSSIATHQIVAIYNGNVDFAGSSSASELQLVSTAANITFSFAPDEAVSAYNVTNLNGNTQASAFPLPNVLAGAQMKITDSTGVSWLAPLYGVFASSNQINFVMPSTVALGPAMFTALLPGGSTMSAVGNVTPTSPAIFTANQNGAGVAAGQFDVVTQPGNVQTLSNIAVFDATQNTYLPNPINLGSATDQVYLELYGTGIRHVASQSQVTATVNGVSVPVAYAGSQFVYPGLDQINLQLPNSLAGSGTVNVIITVNGQTANTVQIGIQ